ncbi:UNKNOWN [Stylonychia lemnae]|uniref:Uncharacterized protein n=1 Tax=Stylonychia lemnae TaxID=5949 RepID=A0A078AQS5_STYLE|nr:UNKNOWN [Stylonychia lemnae]|eukprot:CDW83248.1 UNKNOWN [Stylonychia lemnae]
MGSITSYFSRPEQAASDKARFQQIISDDKPATIITETQTTTTTVDPITNVPNPEITTTNVEVFEKPVTNTLLKKLKNKIYKNDKEYVGDPEREIKLAGVEQERVEVFHNNRLESITEREMNMILTQ